MKFKNLLTPEAGRLNARMTSAIPDTTRYTPNNTAATTIEGPGHINITTPRITARTPNSTTEIQMRCIRSETGCAVSLIDGSSMKAVSQRTHCCSAVNRRGCVRGQRRRRDGVAADNLTLARNRDHQDQ